MAELELHDKDITDKFWSEHNFVFQNNDVFIHAKGTTSIYGKYAYDADVDGRTIIPLNMGQPIIIVKQHKEYKLGFTPHGAGRNLSRSQYLREVISERSVEDVLADEVAHIDARFYNQDPDLSELPET